MIEISKKVIFVGKSIHAYMIDRGDEKNCEKRK
jgi:hypothetical protein